MCKLAVFLRTHGVIRLFLQRCAQQDFLGGVTRCHLLRVRRVFFVGEGGRGCHTMSFVARKKSFFWRGGGRGCHTMSFVARKKSFFWRGGGEGVSHDVICCA